MTAMSCLILEDDSKTGPLLAKLLGENGWIARWATCLNDARIRLKSFDPSLLIVDINLEGSGDGCGTGLDFLREAGHGRRIIVLTAMSDADLVDVEREFPEAEIVRKPIEFVDLLRIIGKGRKSPTDI